MRREIEKNVEKVAARSGREVASNYKVYHYRVTFNYKVLIDPTAFIYGEEAADEIARSQAVDYMVDEMYKDYRDALRDVAESMQNASPDTPASLYVRDLFDIIEDME